MGQVQPQVDQGGQDPVGEDQPVIGARPGSPPTLSATAFPLCGFLPGQPRIGQLLDQMAETCTIKAAEGRMGQGRTGSVMRHNITNPCGHSHVTASLQLPRTKS